MEVTEGEWSLDGGASFREHRGLRMRNKRNWESIAQRPLRSQRGNGGLDGGDSLREHRGLRARKKRNGEASHRGHRGGMEVLMVGALSVNTGAAGRERSAMGKASHRGHGGHRGGNGDLDGGASFRERRGFRARNKRKWGKHRTEVTEVTEGEWRSDGGASFREHLGFRARHKRTTESRHSFLQVFYR
jgi:hypothetical protein